MVGAHASFTLSDGDARRLRFACGRVRGRASTSTWPRTPPTSATREARFGRRVVERLADAGALTERSLLAHCVHVDDREIDLIRDSGAWVAHNPRSNMNNRVGRAPVAGLGDRVALGTDGIDGDMFAESRTAYWRGHEDDPSISPSWVLGRLAAGAAFAGRCFGEPLLGRIEPGAPADLVVLDYDPPTPLSAENLAGHWVFGLSASQRPRRRRRRRRRRPRPAARARRGGAAGRTARRRRRTCGPAWTRSRPTRSEPAGGE